MANSNPCQRMRSRHGRVKRTLTRVVTASLCAVLSSFESGARGESIIIGYKDSIAVTNFPENLMQQIGTLRWYFSHASVGENMMAGISALHQSNPGFYKLTGTACADTPGSITSNGIIYDENRGNPGWVNKVTLFETAASNGWCFPKVNIAMNKFCYIDTDADFGAYTESMLKLETNHRETLFVYATLPLTSAGDLDNYTRNVFNDNLRSWVAKNNCVLFDIADIEAHDATGAPVTFVWNNRICGRLCDDYTTDGGHLNNQGNALVASGFYALAGKLFSSDRDGDGATDGEELVAGTCPTDRRSILKVHLQKLPGSADWAIQWPSASNRFYTLQGGSGRNAERWFSDLATSLPATPPTNSFTHLKPEPSANFYRVEVTQ